jgi:hypothetical protein
MNKETPESILIGETIVSAKIRCHLDEGCDGKNLLVLTTKSGKTIYIEGGYGGYTGNSCGEYYEWIDVKTDHNFNKYSYKTDILKRKRVYL